MRRNGAPSGERVQERVHVATREIVTKDGIRVVPVEDDIVRALEIKDKGIGVRVGEVDLTLSGNINAFGVGAIRIVRAFVATSAPSALSLKRFSYGAEINRPHRPRQSSAPAGAPRLVAGSMRRR